MGRGDWGWGGYYPPAPPKLPPPEHGIKVRKFGSTWWGQRWIQALERFGGVYSARLGRGRSYARQGRVHDLTVKDGAVSARVTGSRPTPYRVTIRLVALADRTWDAAIKAMASRAVFAARLLSGEMPREIDDAFRTCRVSLFPDREKDLATACTCPDWANPCKHVAAVHYVLGEAFDRDPFLLFELRGRTKAAVLAALRRLRAAAGEAPARASREPEEAPAAVTLKKGSPQIATRPSPSASTTCVSTSVPPRPREPFSASSAPRPRGGSPRHRETSFSPLSRAPPRWHAS